MPTAEQVLASVGNFVVSRLDDQTRLHLADQRGALLRRIYPSNAESVARDLGLHNGGDLAAMLKVLGSY